MKFAETWQMVDVSGTIMEVGDIYEYPAGGAQVVRLSGVFGVLATDHVSLDAAREHLERLGYARVAYESDRL